MFGGCWRLEAGGSRSLLEVDDEERRVKEKRRRRPYMYPTAALCRITTRRRSDQTQDQPGEARIRIRISVAQDQRSAP